MSKEENVIKYYVLCNRLKDLIRTGWKNWNVQKDRLESVAEHIYGVQMLAIAMNSEYQYDIDLRKVILMLAVHELEEIKIGDIPMSSMEHETKAERGHKAVREVLSSLLDQDKINALVLEFDERKTKEAIFAYHCDKLECDLQEKIYDEEGYIDMNHQPNNKQYESERVQNMIHNGMKSLTEFWFDIDQVLFQDDENFQKVFQYARDNSITIWKKDSE